MVREDSETEEMGIAAGGLIKQYIQRDTYPPDSWDTRSTTAFNVQVLNAVVFQRVTGIAAPKCPLDAKAYKALGYPFFDIPEDTSTIAGDFGDLKSLRELFFENDGDIKLNPDGAKRAFRTVSEIDESRCANFASFDRNF